MYKHSLKCVQNNDYSCHGNRCDKLYVRGDIGKFADCIYHDLLKVTTFNSKSQCAACVISLLADECFERSTDRVRQREMCLKKVSSNHLMYVWLFWGYLALSTHFQYTIHPEINNKCSPSRAILCQTGFRRATVSSNFHLITPEKRRRRRRRRSSRAEDLSYDR